MRPFVPHHAVGDARTGRRVTALLLSGLLLIVVPGASLAAQDLAVSTPFGPQSIDTHVAEAAQRFGIPVAWIRAVMRVESRNRPGAISPKGAMGLMQIMPATWEGLRVRHALGRDPFDPRDNILAGAAYLRELYDRYGSPGFLAAYNAGPGRYEASHNGSALPAETVAYVNAIMPALDGHPPVEPTRPASVDTLEWVHASLFPARAQRSAANDVMASSREKAEIPEPAIARDVSGIVPPSGGLFVSRSGGGEVQ